MLFLSISTFWNNIFILIELARVSSDIAACPPSAASTEAAYLAKLHGEASLLYFAQQQIYHAGGSLLSDVWFFFYSYFSLI